MRKVYTVLAAVLLLSFAVASSGEALTRSEATRLVFDALRENRFYETRVRVECVMITFDRETDRFYHLALRGNHRDPACGGDPNLAPVIEWFAVHKFTGEVFLDDLIGNRLIPYSIDRRPFLTAICEGSARLYPARLADTQRYTLTIDGRSLTPCAVYSFTVRSGQEPTGPTIDDLMSFVWRIPDDDIHDWGIIELYESEAPFVSNLDDAWLIRFATSEGRVLLLSWIHIDRLEQTIHQNIAVYPF
jgi:hypothetical protein